MSLATTTTNGRGVAVPAVIQPDQIDYGDPARPVVRYSVNDLELMAKKAVASRMYQVDEAQAFTLMMLCEAEGLHPIQALRRFHVIQGRPAMRADAILGEMMRHGWVVEWLSDSRDRAAQAASFTHPRKCPQGKLVSFTIEDARAAGLANRDNWKAHTPAMLRARVISTACRMLDPGIVVGIYTPDEIEEFAGRDTTPAPSPLDETRARLRDAIDGAKRPAIAASEPAPEPARTEFGQWLDGRLAEVHAQWSEAARAAGADPGKAITRHQVGNHLIKAWVESGMLAEAQIETDGRRDRNKVALAIQAAWNDDPDELRDEVDAYLGRKTAENAAALGVPWPVAPVPNEARSDEPTTDAAPGAEWDAGRE